MCKWILTNSYIWHSIALTLSSSLGLGDSTICPDISVYTFVCKMYTNFSQLTWRFRPETNKHQQCINNSKWNLEENSSYNYTFFISQDTTTRPRICETSSGYRLTAVVTQDKECNSSHCANYTSILIVQPLDNDRVPFNVSCSVNKTFAAASMNLVRNMTTHLRFVGRLI
jgi:hypothetical protein